MVAVRTLTRAAIAVLMGAGTVVWYACSDRASDSLTNPTVSVPRHAPDFAAAIAVQRRHTEGLLKMSGVVGTAVMVLPDGRVGMQVLLERDGVADLPRELDGIPVTPKVTGRFMAFSDPTKRQRPAPLGFSVGHPAITAGTIGARVRDTTGRVFILSNSHVLANSNNATIGDPIYQPGVYDGGTTADQIATLHAFQLITFGSNGNNTMDAAVALSNATVLDNATPSDDAYGLPSSAIYGDVNDDGVFDDPTALLGLNVQKYGRTTRLTHGQITGINATVSICYEITGIFCTKSARFVDQLIISPAGFSDGGDSGSLIVTDDGNLNPVALLFAGSATVTIGNRIDLVLNRFGVTIDGLDPPPTGPFTDVGVTSVGAPAAAILDSTTTVTVTVRNRGNQEVSSSFDVTLLDATDSVTVGTQSVAGLAVGASATLTFIWTPHTNGPHSLVGSHTLTDDRATNNQSTVSIPVNPPLTDIAVTAVTAPPAVAEGHAINVAVTVANLGNQPVSSSFVVTLRDATDNVVIDSQTVGGLAVGANAALTFSWNSTNATLGNHALVASVGLTDGNAANNQRSVVIEVKPKLLDVSLTSITGPASVTQGDTAHIGVTVRNSGEQDVGSFDVVLTDATNGNATLVTKNVPGLVIGASVTLDLPWNTASAVVTGHTLIATQMLADGNTTNDARAIGITIKPPVVLVADVAVTAVSGPGGVTQGNTATIAVNLQNVGQQNVSTSFNVVLTDSTAGVIIGTQTVSALAMGASTTVNFSWNTTGAALGSHTLVATHTLTDGNAANNRRSATVTVTPKVTDIALTNFTGPASVFQGETAHFAVTVQNVGQVAVTASFNVVMTDGSAGGVPVATQTVPGLAAGASATVDVSWNTAGAAISGHTLIATQTLPDGNASNNARAIAFTVKPPVVFAPDVSVTALSAPAAVTVGQPANVTVTLGNIGNQAVGSGFIVTLRDATAGVTIGIQTVAALAVGANTTLTFVWSTTGAALGSHSLVASHDFTDANAANNQRSASVTVNPQVMDVSVTSLTTPPSVGQGNTATIGVTVQNVGQLEVGPAFNVVLTDATGGVTIGTQTVTGLTVGASATLTFSWNSTGAALGNHTLVASHNLTDANAANNQRSAVIAVNPRIVDLSLTSLTGPSSVTQGDTAHFGVTVQNVGGQDVGTDFSVVLTDGAVTIGTQTIAGLATGAIATLDVAWNTAGVAVTGHTIMARQTLADNNANNNARAVGIVINAPSVHVGNLTGFPASNGTTWNASVEVTAHDHRHSLVSGVTVRGSWGGPNTGECTTGEMGTCTIVFALIPNSTGLVSFGMSSMTAPGYVYKLAANHDPDGSSNGSTIFVRRP